MNIMDYDQIEYDLEINKIISKIKEEGAKRVCIQLPEGLKPYAGEIVKEIENGVPVEVIIWAGSHWGGCDLAIDVKRLNVDMLIAFGHSEWG